MLFDKNNRAALDTIIKQLAEQQRQLSYQQKLLESILELLDQGEKQALKRKMAMKDYFTSVEGIFNTVNAPALAPFKNILERLKNE